MHVVVQSSCDAKLLRFGRMAALLGRYLINNWILLIKIPVN